MSSMRRISRRSVHIYNPDFQPTQSKLNPVTQRTKWRLRKPLLKTFLHMTLKFLLCCGIILIFAATNSKTRESQYIKHEQLSHAHNFEESEDIYHVKAEHTSLNSVIVYVADLTSPESFEQLKLSLFYLNKNFLFRFPHTVLILYDREIPRTQQYIKVLKTIARVEFQQYFFDGIQDSESAPKVLKCHDKISNIYDRVQTHFMLTSFFSTHLKHYDYYMRLHPSTLLLTPIYYDIFDFMLEHEMTFGYVPSLQKDNCFTENLHEESRSFFNSLINKHNDNNPKNKKELLSPAQLRGIVDMHPAIEVGKVSFFTENNFLSYVKEMQEKLFTFGWTEKKIKTLAINQFVGDEDKLAFNDICFYSQDQWFNFEQTITEPLHHGCIAMCWFLAAYFILFKTRLNGSLFGLTLNLPDSLLSFIIVCGIPFVIGMHLFYPWIESVIYAYILL